MPKSCSRSAPIKQQGVALIVTLIVLVALLIGSVALIRAVDTGTLVAGNLALKQAAIHSGDGGVELAYQYLQARAGTPALNNTDAVNGYYSIQIDPAAGKDWTDDAYWAGAPSFNVTDASGAVTDTVQYQIHRMCTQPGLSYNDAANSCQTYAPAAGTAVNGSKSSDTENFQGAVMLFYRVTCRIKDARNMSSITQAMIVLGA